LPVCGGNLPISAGFFGGTGGIFVPGLELFRWLSRRFQDKIEKNGKENAFLPPMEGKPAYVLTLLRISGLFS